MNNYKRHLNICVLQPDYSTSDVDYQLYDPPRNLSHLMPEASFEYVFLNKLTTYKQLKELRKKNFDIFVNLCEGYLEWEVPSIDVIYFLELLKLPFTGPTSVLYDPSKELMKYVAYTVGIQTPKYILINSQENIEMKCADLNFPLFVKPSKAGDSLGIDKKSFVYNYDQLRDKIKTALNDFDELLIEEFIDGREFTVMLMADAENKEPIVFQPVEYIFHGDNSFKTYSLKTSDLHPDANVPVTNKFLNKQLKDAAAKIFTAFNGVGYARLDFRMDKEENLFFLEINFTCSVFYSDGYEGSADHILKYDGYGQENFLRNIINEGIERYRKKQKKYFIKGNSISGYGIYAAKYIAENEIIFEGEERSQRIVTKSFVENNWNDQQKEDFKKYAYPISNEVYILWDNNPSEWAPQNHSCNPNTKYQGLNVVAVSPIKKGDELTLDYSVFLDDEMQSFNCNCGEKNCRGIISGTGDNSITIREKN